MAKSRADGFVSLPTELQVHTFSWLDTQTLKATSIASKHLRALALPFLFSTVKFGSHLQNEILLYFAAKCAPEYGKYCQDLGLVFNLGPLLAHELDLQRAAAFATVLRHASLSLRKLTIDTAGTSLSSCATTIEALQSCSFPNLLDFDLRCYDPQEDEVDILSGLFVNIAVKPNMMPSLKSFALQGDWSLSADIEEQEDIDTTPLFHSLSLLLAAKSSLISLRLSCLDIQAPSLRRLFQASSGLQGLTLTKIDSLSLREVMESLIETSIQQTLRVLVVHLKGSLIPSSQMRFQAKSQYTFPGLNRLTVTWNQGHRVAATSDRAVFALYGSLFRCSQLRFPSLKVADIGEGFSCSAGSAQALAAHILLAKSTSMPALRELTCEHDAPTDNIENVSRLLKKSGIDIRRAEAEGESQKEGNGPVW